MHHIRTLTVLNHQIVDIKHKRIEKDIFFIFLISCKFLKKRVKKWVIFLFFISAQTPSRISRCLRATTFPERTRLRKSHVFTAKTLHRSILLYSTQTNSTKTTQKLLSTLLFCISFIFFYFSDFSFYIYPFLSLFSYFSFFTHLMLPVFLHLFLFLWARQRGSVADRRDLGAAAGCMAGKLCARCG